jgi:hypothetical protein
MYWAADVKKTETQPLLQRNKLFPAALTFKIPSRDLEMESKATSGPSDTLWIYRDSLDADKNLRRHYSLETFEQTLLVSQNSVTHGLYELKAKT